VFYPVGVIFKGSGFYVTDNRRGSNGTVRSSRKDSDTSSGNGKGESSTAATGEAPKSDATKSEGEKAKS
jgi:hypothetical protein